MIVSVHLPKTAGTSFNRALIQALGSRLSEDYGDMYRVQKSPKLAFLWSCIKLPLYASKDYQGIECIHGHLMPFKFLLLEKKLDIKYITWFRDPVERIASHYYYWKKGPAKTVEMPELHIRMLEEDWTLEKFVFSNELRNLYSRYLAGFPIEKFSFIGLTENYATDIKLLSESVFGIDLENIRSNITQKRETSNYINDLALRREIEKFHRKDMDLYLKALRIREGIINGV